ncbi:LysR family transcriptional regulator ArgP [Streptomyces sp. NRRL S-1521]|uniref:LysR family transcriptional regulator ArgP n=1 Tax=Streptomyces sp. NRRL S-1521 TaxID=1609100 RepID=UPI0007483CD8|nr:LysR family transcriptional regulator ArgP [Streptomyces sp. NRRL S-1521]KUL53042.1 chromosome replication initiation inhibitor protein [Streptomyces sp. NRRL S-1521]
MAQHGSLSELPLEQVRTLLAVVDEGTFDAAAAALHVTPPAVSQRVKALERRTGRVLLTRTKPVRPTESGQVVVRFARQLARLERDARADLGIGESGQGALLPVAVNADSLATWFLTALARVPAELRVCFELRREDEVHTTSLLREGAVMAAVTSSPDAVSGCTVRRLGRVRYLPVASPGFIERWLGDWPGAPLERVIADAPVLLFDRRDTLQDQFAREVTGGRDAGALRHYVPSSRGFAEAIEAGLGWGVVPRAQAEPLLRAGALRLLDPERVVDVPLFWQQWKLDSPALAALADAVVSTAAEALDQ